MTQDALPSNDADRAAPLTRHNLKSFNNERRREGARRRGWSTPSASPDFHSYCETVSSRDLPPPSQRLKPLIRPKRTASAIARSLEEFDKWCAEVAPRPPLPPDQRQVLLQSLSPYPSDPPQHQPDWDDSAHQAHPATQMIGGVGDGDDKRQASALPWSSRSVGAGDQAQQSMVDGANSESSRHFEPTMLPALDANGLGWEPGPPPLPCLPTSRPSIPRQQPPPGSPGQPEPQFPPSFPAYHCTQNMNEIAAYLANASYVVALGGPPLADLKYGIIVVPAGDESVLFGPSPKVVFDQGFIDAIDDANRDYDRALRMHDPDKDSEEFVRHRFDDDFPSVSAGAQQNVEVALPEEEHLSTEDIQEPQRKRQRRGSHRRPSGADPNGAATAL